MNRARPHEIMNKQEKRPVRRRYGRLNKALEMIHVGLSKQPPAVSIPSGPCVYFIACGVYTKIGIAANVAQRMSTMQSGNPIPLKLICAYQVANQIGTSMPCTQFLPSSEPRASGLCCRLLWSMLQGVRRQPKIY